MYFLTFVVQRYFICKTAKTNKNMNYNFDEVIDRRGTCSEKVDGMVNVWGKSDLIPMWVADMDFGGAGVVDGERRCACYMDML